MKTIYYIKATPRQSRKKHYGFLVFFLFSIGVVFMGSTYLSKKTTPSVLSATVITTPTPETSTLTPILQKESLLPQIVGDALADSKGSYAVVIKHLTTGEEYRFNDNTRYDSASLYKLWVMTEVYEQIKNGTLKGTDILFGDVTTLHKKFNIATESALLKEGTVTFSINEALTKMITVSDNYAAFLLTEKVRLAPVSAMLKREGLTSSLMGTSVALPSTTASDIAVFYEKLYYGKLINMEYSEKMLTLLKSQKLNGKLPKYLPDDVTIAHKTGELNQFSHDAGIVYTPNGDYIIVVLSKTTNPAQAVEKIAKISEGVYNYFTTE